MFAKYRRELEEKFITEVPTIDAAAAVLYEANPEMAREFITNYSVNMGEYTVQRYKELGQFLLVKYIDGNIKKEENGVFLRSPEGYPLSPGSTRLFGAMEGDRCERCREKTEDAQRGCH